MEGGAGAGRGWGRDGDRQQSRTRTAAAVSIARVVGQDRGGGGGTLEFSNYPVFSMGLKFLVKTHLAHFPSVV